MNMQYRQGDVLLIPTRIPLGAQPKKLENRLILAHGEATGHCHAFTNQFAKAYQHLHETYILVTEGATLVHEKHAPIKVAPGSYKVIKQREYVKPVDESAINWEEMAMD